MSDIDFAVVDSSIHLGEATDEDLQLLPIDDIPFGSKFHLISDLQTQQIKSVMAVKESSAVPLISVTSDDDLIGKETDKHKEFKKAIKHDLTSDFEDSENEESTSILPFIKPHLSKNQISILTDTEVLDSSDDEQVLTGAVKKKTFRAAKIESPHLSILGAKKFYGIFKDTGGVTDMEEYNFSESTSEDNDVCDNTQEDVDIISALLRDDETVDIADRLKRSPTPSPSMTPVHELRVDNKKKVKKSKKIRHSVRKNFNQNSISPRSLSPHLSDLTDTEVIYSDSDEDTRYVQQRPLSPYERKRRFRSTHAEIISSPDFLDNTLSLPEPAVLHISETPPPNLITSSNTESDDTAFSEKDEITVSSSKNIFFSSKVQPNVLLRKDSVIENSVFTDEELYGISNESGETEEEVSISSELHLQIVDNFCGSTAEKELNKDLLKSSESDKPNLTDIEDIEAEDDLEILKSHSVSTSTETTIRDMSMGPGDKSKEISIYHTDCKKTINEDVDNLYHKTSEIVEDTSIVLPDAVRNLILTKEDQSGRPVSVMIPLGSLEPSGLIPPIQELEGGTSELEDLEVSDIDDTAMSSYYPRYPTPELPDFEGNVIIEDSELVKTDNDKLKVQKILPEPVTDTEDLLLCTDKKPKKGKLRHKNVSSLKHRDAIAQNKTDTEEIDISDRDEKEAKGVLVLPASEPDPMTDVDDMYISGDDDVEDKHHFTSVTPDCLKDINYDTVTTSKEDMGPFSAEARQQFLSIDVPKIYTTSPTPDVPVLNSTDSEDMTTSADEDAYSRAETMTPFDVRMEFEDQSSTVYMKHTSKFDLDAPEEAIHVKGAVDVRESFTDIEDLGFSEDEPPHQLDHVSVNDTVNEVCVCFNSDTKDRGVKVCVCVGKKHGELSLMWQNNISTDASGMSAQGMSSIILTSHSFNPHNYHELNLVSPSKCRVYQNPVVRNHMVETCLNIVHCRVFILVEKYSPGSKTSLMLAFRRDRNIIPLKKVSVLFCMHQTSLGFVTKIVVSNPDISLRNIVIMLIGVLKTVFLPYSDYVETSYIRYFNNLSIVKKKKKKQKIENRSWSGSILESVKNEHEFRAINFKSSSVSKLISQFESLSSSNESFVNNNRDEIIDYLHDDELSDAGDDAPFLNRIAESKCDKTFKPIVKIIPLKDRSVSPRRLDPASIKDSPAFRALCERAQGAIERITAPFHHNPVQQQITSQSLIGKIQRFESLCKGHKEHHHNNCCHRNQTENTRSAFESILTTNLKTDSVNKSTVKDDGLSDELAIVTPYVKGTKTEEDASHFVVTKGNKCALKIILVEGKHFFM